jgi:hypothetical protein
MLNNKQPQTEFRKNKKQQDKANNRRALLALILAIIALSI